MSIPNRQIGWSNESNLLWQIAKKLERLTGVTFTSLSALAPTYKVYTALLTQVGGDFLDQLDETTPTQNVTKGVTYTIANASDGDFLNVGAPNNNTGTSFVAINNSVPTSWGQSGAALFFNTGAPVVTVLENTIGNIWWTFVTDGKYSANSNDAFTEDKTAVFVGPLPNGITEGYSIIDAGSNESLVIIGTVSVVYTNELLYETPIEIRVYN